MITRNFVLDLLHSARHKGKVLTSEVVKKHLPEPLREDGITFNKVERILTKLEKSRIVKRSVKGWNLIKR